MPKTGYRINRWDHVRSLVEKRKSFKAIKKAKKREIQEKKKKNPNEDRGRISQERVFGVLNSLIGQMGIVAVKEASKTEDFFCGTDLWVFFESGQEMPLQVKSSFFFIKKHLNRFPSIPVIVVEDWDDEEKIKTKLLEIIPAFLNK